MSTSKFIIILSKELANLGKENGAGLGSQYSFLKKSSTFDKHVLKCCFFFSFDSFYIGHNCSYLEKKTVQISMTTGFMQTCENVSVVCVLQWKSVFSFSKIRNLMWWWCLVEGGEGLKLTPSLLLIDWMQKWQCLQNAVVNPASMLCYCITRVALL